MAQARKALACTISRGGFSDERVFEIKGTSHKGVCSRSHLWKEDGNPLEPGEPPIGQVIDGFVAARILEVRGDHVTVSIPDGEVLTVAIAELVDRPSGVEQHVSLGS
jgi:hypothetical protein